MAQGLQRQAADLLCAAEPEVDLEVKVLEWADSEEVIMHVGGRWSVDERRWVGDAKSCAIWRMTPAEYEAAYWFAEWLAGYFAGKRVPAFSDVYTLLLEGGRGGGKSDFGVRAIALIALGMSDRICWDVSPVDDETDELKRVMDGILCPQWYRWLKSDSTWRFWNGSEIQLLSGYNPNSLKRGRVDGVLLNEGQRFQKAAYMMARPRVADTSGLCMVTANPPNQPIGRWITEMHDGAEAKALRGVHVITFDNRKNPTLDWRAMEILRDEFGDDDFQREVMGVFIPIGDLVFYAWLPSVVRGNIRPAPEHGDITRQVTRQHLGREFDHVIGVDFQLSPYMAGAAVKFFDNVKDLDDPLMWAVDDMAVEGTEDDFVDELEARGYDPERTALVCDASGEWQDGARTKGRGSFDMLRKRGWNFIYCPDKKMKKNPLIIERCQATNARMCSARKSKSPYRRLFSIPQNKDLNVAVKSWDNRNGTPFRRSPHAHLCDALSYVVWRFFPRKAKRGRVVYKPVKRKRSRRERDLDRI